jgi:hypothetical protein
MCTFGLAGEYVIVTDESVRDRRTPLTEGWDRSSSASEAQNEIRDENQRPQHDHHDATGLH